MRQLWIYILQNLFVGICELFDTAFGNNISIDSICVLSAYTIITWVAACIYQAGIYAYRILLSKEKNCLSITVSTSIILSIIVFTLSDKIPHLYSLTETQYILFSKCLRVYAICIPLIAIGDFLADYIMYKCKNKLMFISNLIFYILMLSLDAFVYLQGKELHYLIITTGISYFVYDIIVLIKSNILKVDDKIKISNIKICLKHSINIVTDRILGKIATITFNIYASKLGTEMYAIHGVCYSIAVTTEYITNAQCDFQMTSLKKIDKVQDKFKQCISNFKNSCLPCVIIGYTIAFTLLIFLHGDVPIKSCTVPLILYTSQVFFIQLYENFRGYLTSLQRSDILKWAGLIGIFIRIPVTLISYYSGIGIYGFALASSLDFLVRGIYYFAFSKRILKEGKNKRNDRIAIH